MFLIKIKRLFLIKIPESFIEVLSGILLSDGTLRLNGKFALLGIQQTHFELTKGLWDLCYFNGLVLKEIHTIERPNRQKFILFKY